MGEGDCPRHRGCRRAPPDALRSGSPGRRGHPWRGGGARRAARHSGRVHRSGIRCTAAPRPVSVRAGDAGNRPSGRAMPTIGRTRPGRSARGRNAIAATDASIGARIRNTARAIATRRDSGGAIAGNAQPGLQRWTRQGRFRACLQGLTGSCRRVPRSLQRWTRGSWK
jgi:hypothetical protein